MTGPAGLVGFFKAVGVVRNAQIGFGIGIVFAALVYVYRIGEVLGPVQDQRGSPLLFLLLAFVLAVGVGILVTGVLTLRSVIQHARELD